MQHNTQRSKHIAALVTSAVLILFTQVGHAYANAMTYTGLQLGGSSMDYSAKNQGFPGASDSDSGGIAWHIFGGYQFNANFAAEVGFTEYNDVSIDNIGGNKSAKASISQRSVNVLGKLIYPLNSLFDVYVQGGVAYVANEKELNSAAKATGASLGDSHGLAIAYGLGGSYAFYPNAKLDLTWQRVASSGGVRNSNFAGIGVTLFFS